MQAAEFMARLERVKENRDWSWQETAKAMELSRSMLHFIKTGKYSVSEKAAKRLHHLEAQAGISPRAQAVIEAISKEAERAKPKVSTADIEAGYADVEVKFLSGGPQPASGQKIRLSRPNIQVRAKLVGDIRGEQSYHPVLLACLPPELANDSFLNLLNVHSYNALAEAAMALVFGFEWEKNGANMTG
jgi:transcriptional regulator with XRE-family HTH domain